MAREDEHVIDVDSGARLIFSANANELWIALQTSGDSIEDFADAGESFIVAGSIADVDALIDALNKTKRLFDPSLECDEAAEP